MKYLEKLFKAAASIIQWLQEHQEPKVCDVLCALVFSHNKLEQNRKLNIHPFGFGRVSYQLCVKRAVMILTSCGDSKANSMK